MSLIHINARSLKKNFDDFQLLLSSVKFDFDIIAVSETWFHPNLDLNIYSMQGYSLIQQCRDNKNGGGVAIYVKHNIQYKIRNDLTCITPDYEIVSIETNEPLKKPIVITCIYRPPSSDIPCFIEKMNSVLELLDSERKEIYIMGDFNIDLLNCASHDKTKDFLEKMFSFYMLPLISKPTRVSTKTATLIDIFFLQILK